MPAQLLGAHRSASGGVHNAILDAHRIGCTAAQVFTSSPQQWKTKPVTAEMVDAFKRAVAETGLTEIVSHESYLINLCAPDDATRNMSIDGLQKEMIRCALYGIPGVVSHLGSHKGQGEELGLAGIVESLRVVLDSTPDNVALLMETTAGQGSALMYRFEHLAYVLEELGGHPRLGVCVDTCHIFSAGYDIRTAEGFDRTFAEFARLVGFDRLKAVHCNDSKKGLGTRVDRHEHIGQGEIGAEAFRAMVNDPRFERIPIVLETDSAEQGHERDLATLRSFIVN